MSDDGNGKNNGRLPGAWMAYTLDTKLDQVRAMFARRHGYAPAEVIQAGPILLAGPIGGNGHKRPQAVQGGTVTPQGRRREQTTALPRCWHVWRLPRWR